VSGQIELAGISVIRPKLSNGLILSVAFAISMDETGGDALLKARYNLIGDFIVKIGFHWLSP
jgi:hypothetical protein